MPTPEPTEDDELAADTAAVHDAANAEARQHPDPEIRAIGDHQYGQALNKFANKYNR